MDTVQSEEATFRLVRMVDSLEHARVVDWLPDGRTLITERAGRLLLVDGNSTTVLSGVPGDNPFVGREDARPEVYTYGHLYFLTDTSNGGLYRLEPVGDGNRR